MGKDYAVSAAPYDISYGAVTWPPGYAPRPVLDAYTGAVVAPGGVGYNMQPSGFRAVPMSGDAKRVLRNQVAMQAWVPPARVPAWWAPFLRDAIIAGAGLLWALLLAGSSDAVAGHYSER